MRISNDWSLLLAHDEVPNGAICVALRFILHVIFSPLLYPPCRVIIASRIFSGGGMAGASGVVAGAGEIVGEIVAGEVVGEIVDEVVAGEVVAAEIVAAEVVSSSKGIVGGGAVGLDGTE